MKQVVSALMFLALASFPAAADTVNFSNLPGTKISFTGNGTGADFKMTTVLSGGHQAGFTITDTALAGLKGAVSGTYHYNKSAITIIGGMQTAPVTLKSGPSTFMIWDAGGNAFTANVAWIEIFTSGTTGGLNSGGTINLTNFAYAGANPNLIALAAGGNGILTASFQFVPSRSLTQLAAAGTRTTSYSGSLTVPDGGLTAMLLGGALVGIEALRRKLHV